MLDDSPGLRAPTTEFDLPLIGRCYELYADHAVSVADRMAYRAGARELRERADCAELGLGLVM